MGKYEETIKSIICYDDERTPGFKMYGMKILYDYSIDNIISTFTNLIQDGASAEDAVRDAIQKELEIENPVNIRFQSFGCTAFHLKDDSNGHYFMGRNYDNGTNTSAMVVHCNPKNRYRSIAFAALSNLDVIEEEGDCRIPEDKRKDMIASPFVCLDGINEKGVSIAVLVNGDNEHSTPPCKEKGVQPTHQTCKDGLSIFTTLAIRLVLDHADSTAHAVKLLEGYNMVATGKFDYHFYINDENGDGRVVEYDCNDLNRSDVVLPTDIVTNFFIKYIDQVKHGVSSRYGHGKDRYDKVQAVLDEHKGKHSMNIVYKALMEAAQEPTEQKPSNTQWSIIFNNTTRRIISFYRRNWSGTYLFDVDKI